MMNFSFSTLIPVIPEIFLLVMGCIALLVGIFLKRNASLISYIIVQISLLVAGLLVLFVAKQATQFAFNGTFILDPLAVLLKIAILIAGFVVFIYSRDYVHQQIPDREVEYYVLGLFSIIGMMILVSSYNLLVLFLGLELFSLPVYAMVAMWRDSKVSIEAAMKYFVIGSIASGILLYGMSMLYGATQSLDMNVVAQMAFNTQSQQYFILVAGLVFVMVGVAFKLGAVPFHMWVPDVYEGASDSMTLFIASAPKIAALGMAIRLLVNAMPSLSIEWQQMLIVIALLSMAIGNIVAIVQTNLKRMLAYSSIAHMGYMTLGLLTANATGYAAATFYMIAYVVMTMVAFGMIVILSKTGYATERIEDFQGLNSRNPWLAFIMLLVMFSMAGIPPLVGFMAKVAVLEALIRVNLIWLAVVALLFAIIGSYYYLKVVKVMYFESPKKNMSTISCSRGVAAVMTMNGLLVLILGVFPGLLFNICRHVFNLG